MKKIGQITLSDSVYVTDPCYETDVWCLKKVDNVKPGTYNCYAEIKNTESAGRRVFEIIVANSKSPDISKLSFICDEKADIGVDSGQAGIFDAAYYEENQSDEEWYEKVCDITSGRADFCGTVDNKGFVSSSGYGDGSYDLYFAKDKKDNIIALKIVFIDEFEEEL